MKILVTGGAGFIGSHFVRFILKEEPKHSIVNLDKLTYCGDLSRLRDVENHPRYLFVEGDICDEELVDRLLKDCQAVIHFAAETHVDRSLLHAKDFIDTNIFGTYTLLEAAKKHRIKKFVHVSTDEVYGSREKGFFKEEDALNPTSPYSISKTAADQMALVYAHSHDVPVSVTRGSNTFGSFQYPEKVIPLFVARALSNEFLPLYGDGRQIRNWLHAEDHARAVWTVFKKGKNGEAYNVSTRNDLTNIELTKKILRILGKPESLIKKVTDRIGHDRRYAIDSKKLRKLGWKDEKPFEESIRETVLWYRTNEIWWRRIKEKSESFKQYYAEAYKGKA